jgi:hypothetical protein
MAQSIMEPAAEAMTSGVGRGLGRYGLRLRAYARGSDFPPIFGNNISISKCLKPRQIFAIGVTINGK